MQMKQLNLAKSVYELTQEYPELVDVLSDIGFTDITKPGMLQSAGRFMTIPKGAKLKRFDLNEVLAALRERGFEPQYASLVGTNGSEGDR